MGEGSVIRTLIVATDCDKDGESYIFGPLCAPQILKYHLRKYGDIIKENCWEIIKENCWDIIKENLKVLVLWKISLGFN